MSTECTVHLAKLIDIASIAFILIEIGVFITNNCDSGITFVTSGFVCDFPFTFSVYNAGVETGSNCDSGVLFEPCIADFELDAVFRLLSDNQGVWR